MPQTTNKKMVTFAAMTTPAKALATCVILFISLGMAGAMAQIIIHDVIPTFFSEDPLISFEDESTEEASMSMESSETSGEPSERGDLFSDLSEDNSQMEMEKAEEPSFDREQLIWTLKWTHIHLFGINMIFIFMGGVALFLDISSSLKTWLIVLPFIGVFIDIATMWLKNIVSPHFFWLHLFGGGLFTAVFLYVSLRALWEMWIAPESAQ